MNPSSRWPAFAGGILFGILSLAQSALAQDPVDILFVGNSFTHGHTAPALTYNASQITDANGSGYGGVAGIFKQLTIQEGLNYNVTIEAVGGQTLQWHYENKASIIGQSIWDTVILQEQSTLPLPSDHGGSPGAYATGAENLQNLVLASNPAAQLFLYETWASPASVTNQGYAGSGGLQAMQDDLRAGTYDVYYDLAFSGVARVGDAFLRAVDQGVADANPSDGLLSGTINLWAGDARHASAYGSYLSAAVIYARVTGADPRSLSVGAGSAAFDLGLDAGAAGNLNRIAFEITALAEPAPLPNPPEPAKLPVTAATITGSASAGTPATITGNANITTLTTAEGVFTALIGATANAVVTSQAISWIGTNPGNASAAVSGLSLNDGVNNLQSGNFQFSMTLDANTRFFIIENAPKSSALGDSATITLLDAFNNQVGAFSLSLSVADFTNSPANNTANALATIFYTAGDGNRDAKLGAVSFSLADFGVTDFSAISAVTGIRIVSTTIDPNAVGMYSVPEPGTALLALSGMGVLMFSRRRACRV